MFPSARRTVRYTDDLMSPAQLTLLRHPKVVSDEDAPTDEAPASIEAWSWRELPDGPTVELRRTLERLP
jgi:hypothetical protein